MVARVPKPPRPQVSPSAILLLRVSTQRQADSGLGLEAQEAKCRELCALRGWPVAAVYTDAGISGRETLARRPGLRAALSDVHSRPGAVLVVYSLSRLARSLRLLSTLIDAEGKDPLPLVSATESFDTITAQGRVVLNMLASFAQFEAELVGERTKAALAAAKLRGTRIGAPSMIESTDADGKRFVDASKVTLVRRVQALYAAGGLSHMTLAKRLNDEGIRSVTGKQWHARTVRVAINTALPTTANAA